jgi:hypothetical protein
MCGCNAVAENIFFVRVVASTASHTASAASVFGCAVRVWPHSHLSVNTYWPKWSDYLTTVSGGRGGIIR